WTRTAGGPDWILAWATPSYSPVSHGLSTLIRNFRRANGEAASANGSPPSWAEVGGANPEQAEARRKRSAARRLTPDLPRLLEVGEADLREIHPRLGARLSLDGRRAFGRAALAEELHQLHLELHHVARKD